MLSLEESFMYDLMKYAIFFFFFTSLFLKHTVQSCSYLLAPLVNMMKTVCKK